MNFPNLKYLDLNSARNHSLTTILLPESVNHLSISYGKSKLAIIGENLISCDSLIDINVFGSSVENISIPDGSERVNYLSVNFSATYFGKACREGKEWALKRRDSLAVKFPSISFFSGGF